MARRQRQLLTGNVNIRVRLGVEEQVLSKARVVICVIRSNREIVPDSETRFQLATLQLLCSGIGQEASLRGDYHVAEVEAKDLRLVAEPILRNRAPEPYLIHSGRLRREYCWLVVWPEIECRRFERVAIVRIQHRPIAPRPKPVADASGLGRPNDVAEFTLGVIPLRRREGRECQVTRGLAFVGLVEAYSSSQIPAVGGLPVQLHVLPGEPPLVTDVAVLVNRQLCGWRRNHGAIERDRIRAVAVECRLLPVAVEHVRSDEQGGIADLTAKVCIKIVIEDEAILILCVGGATQVGMQKRADIRD